MCQTVANIDLRISLKDNNVKNLVKLPLPLRLQDLFIFVQYKGKFRILAVPISVFLHIFLQCKNKTKFCNFSKSGNLTSVLAVESCKMYYILDRNCQENVVMLFGIE